MIDKLYSTDQLAQHLGIDCRRISYLLRTGKIPTPQKIGRCLVFTEFEMAVIRVLLDTQGDKWQRGKQNEERKTTE